MRRPFLVRFFLVAPPVPVMMAWTFLATAAVAATVLAVDPERGEAAVTPILALQLFASASGFSAQARRGHYDLLLTSGNDRHLVALAHWVVSVAPGLTAWTGVGIGEALLSGWTRLSAFAPGTCVAVMLVSTLPWALSTALPRFAPSIGWLLVLVTIFSAAPAEQIDAWVRAAASGPPSYAAGAVALLYPFALIGRHLGADDWPLLVPTLGTVVVSMAIACRWLTRADFPLEAAQ